MKDNNFHSNEIRLIEYLRELKFGKVEIVVRDGIPQKIIKKEQNIVLGEEKFSTGKRFDKEGLKELL